MNGLSDAPVISSARLREVASVLPQRARNSWLMEVACLAAGFDTLRLRSTAVMALRSGDSPPIPFWGTASPLTSATAHRATISRVMRRQLLQDAGVRVPPSQTYFKADREHAVRYAERIGYPVVVKPVERGGSVAPFPPQWSAEGVRQAIDGMRRADLRRPGNASPKYRVLVEKVALGGPHEALVIGDRVRGVMREDAHGQTRLIADPEALEQQMHPSVGHRAITAMQAMQGLDHAAVTVHAEDLSRPAEEQDCAVTSLWANPSFWRPGIPAAWALQFAMQVVERSVQVAGAQVAWRSPDADVAATLTLSGATDPDALEGHMRRAMPASRPQTRLEVDHQDGCATVRAQGALVEVAALSSSAFTHEHPVQSAEVAVR